MSLILVAAAIALLVLAGPWLVDTLANRRGGADPAAVSAAARTLHARLWIADLHADSLLWNRDLLAEHRRGHVDLPRLARGNVALQVFTVVSKVPIGVNFTSNADTSDLVTPLIVLQRWPARTWGSLRARAEHQARKLHDFARASGGRLVVVTTARQVQALAPPVASADGAVGALLGIEGAQVLEGELAALDDLFALGFRLLGLSHFFDTDVAGSAHGRVKGGLTALGRAVLERAAALGMVVDLAHASPAAIDEVTERATRPVLVSHTGVQGTCAGPRNLTDRQMDRVAATGGLVGVAFFPTAVCGRDPAAITRAIRHAADRVGADHVALGSDFDGTVRTPFDCAGLVVLTDALLAAGFADHEIAAIMGGNVKRVLVATLPE